MKRAIDSIVIGKRARKRMGDIPALAASIKDVGLLHPIVVNQRNRLIAGRRRLLACKSLGMVEVPIREIPLHDLLRGEFDENFVRENFTPSEWVEISKAWKGQEQRAAKVRQSEAGKQFGRGIAGANFAPATKGKSRERIARAAGISHATLKKAEEVCEAAEAEPKKYQPLVAEMNRTGRVNGVYKKLMVARQMEKIQAEPLKPPDSKYRVLVVDPPWRYGRSAHPGHRAANPYAAMSLDEIYALPIGDWAHEDSILWLWATNAFLREAFTCLDEWGFKQKTVLTWVKNRIGTGDWLRGKTEHCLLAVRGKPTVALTSQSTVLLANAGKHSEKPAEFYELVEGLCPGSKLDVFARARRDGWESYRHEVQLRAGAK